MLGAGEAQGILDFAHAAFVSMNAAGEITFWNRRAEEIFGIPRQQAVGRVLAEVCVPERYREAHQAGLQRYLQTREGPMIGQRVEISAVRADGSEFPVELTITVLEDASEPSFHAFIADISERTRAEAERARLLEQLEQALRGSEQRLAVIMDALAEAVTIRGRDHRLMHANRAALARMGLHSVEELVQADPRELMGGWETTAEDGSTISLEDLPSMRVLRGERAEPLTLRTVHRETGEERWVLLKATAIRDERGAPEAAVTIIEDVTAAKRSALRNEFLVRAGQVLASSLDYEETLRNVAGLAVPHIADWCAVDLFDEEEGRQPVAVAHVDPSKLDLAERLRGYEPQTLDPEQGLGLVWRTGEPALYSDIPDEMLAAAAVDEEHLQLLRAVGMRAALIVPMNVRGRTIGALTLVSAESGRTFDREDVEFTSQIAERAALAVENARLYSARSDVARTLQASLLPEAIPEIPGWEVEALYRPAGHETEVGGDFYDLWQSGGDWMMMIGDVTGKGVAAAAVTSLVRHTAWAAADFDTRPASVLSRVDVALKRRPSLPVSTALCMCLSGGTGTLACGGHPPPLLAGRDGVRELGRHGTILGAFANATWPEAEFALQPGETIVAFTDGVTDTVGADGERFGLGRMKEILGQMQNESPTSIRERLEAALEEFQVGPQVDDTAVVIMRFTGAALRTATTPDGRGRGGPPS